MNTEHDADREPRLYGGIEIIPYVDIDEIVFNHV